MEKRKEKRFKQRIIVKIDNTPGLIIDLAKNGIQASITAAPKRRRIDLNISVDNVEYAMQGYVRWARKVPALTNLVHLGITIINPPADYIRFIEENYADKDQFTF
jgi:hypothetical protein